MQPAAPLALPTDTPCHCSTLRKAARHLTQLYDHALAPAGLRASQVSVLATLRRSGPLAIGELAALLVMDRTTMGRALRPLAREGLLAIGPGRDRRTRSLSLTEAGEARLAAARPLWLRAQALFEEGYDADAAIRLREDLRRVIRVE